MKYCMTIQIHKCGLGSSMNKNKKFGTWNSRSGTLQKYSNYTTYTLSTCTWFLKNQVWSFFQKSSWRNLIFSMYISHYILKMLQLQNLFCLIMKLKGLGTRRGSKGSTICTIKRGFLWSCFFQGYQSNIFYLLFLHVSKSQSFLPILIRIVLMY